MVLIRWERIQHILCDVDGVLTEGILTYTASGEQTKTFSARDGHLIRVALRAGIGVGLVSGRRCAALEYRAKDLGLDPCFLGVGDKRAVVTDWLAGRDGLDWEHLAFVGDDLPDLTLFGVVGCAVAVGDAAPRLRQCADLVTAAPGGRGAVGEFIERLLRARGAWSPDEWGRVHG